ncbi:TetR/AcrR family transcriptional regulator [Methylobacterium flocculans]|uniref:TetR/AcrR family transcriptional regulator n=1 Tax=Methylobacterium flocculans TaxID=2984843 RepID=UPI0021F35A89|nr:TetR/AcrR family transcriptional regulator [Methylobacterium sp. FF17]
MAHSEPQDDIPAGTRARILAAAAELIAAGGIEAATTRAVSTAAVVQAPTIYRLFGDKRGLLDAVAEQAFATYVAGKAARTPNPDPVADLRQGWDDHVAFGLAHPAIFTLISMPAEGASSTAAAAGLQVLHERVRRVAQAGRLRVGEERAVDMIHAAGTGTILTLLGHPRGEHADFSDAAREAVMAAVLDERQASATVTSATMASGLRSHLDGLDMLSPGERHLMDELLRRVADAGR